MPERPMPILGLCVATRVQGRLWAYALLMGLYSGLAVWKEATSYRDLGDQPPDVHAALSLVLGLLLVFRTNRAYARWWEARCLWGALVNCCRNFAVEVRRFVEPDPAEREAFRLHLVGFPYALKEHLREGTSLEQTRGFGGHPDCPRHVPAYLVSKMYGMLAGWKRAGRIDGEELLVVNREAAKLLDICGACERIRNTPKAPSYRAFVRLGVLLYVLTLPWALVQSFQMWTIAMTIVMSYFMIGASMKMAGAAW